MSKGFIQLKRSQETEEMLQNEPNCFLLLTLIAFRAKRSNGSSVFNLESGEALIGDYKACGLTRMQFRTTIKKLKRWGIITTKATNKGTVARLINIDIWDINIETNNQQDNQQVTNKEEKSNQQVTTNNNDKNKEKNKEDKYIAVFFFWNSLEIVIHQKLTDKIKTKIRASLKDYKSDEILEAINNYAKILKDDDYYWSHKWTLIDFLQRGIDKFLSSADPFENYRVKDDLLHTQKKGFRVESDGEPYPVDIIE